MVDEQDPTRAGAKPGFDSSGGRMDEETRTDRVAALEQQVAELQQRLDERDKPSATRRQVLGSMATGGVLGAVAGAGSASAATGTGAIANVGGVTANTYRVTGNWYGGPAAARSELVSELDGDDTGARYGADDTGEWYYWNGSAWESLPSGGSQGDALTIAPSSGIDLAGKLVDSLGEDLTGEYRGGIVRQPADGSAYSWDSDVTITPPDGVAGFLHIDPDVRIEYGGSGYPLTLEEAGWGGVPPTFDVIGGTWTATGSDPSGCIRLNDTRNCFIMPRQIRDFSNTTDDAWGIVLRNVDSFCERNFLAYTKFTNTDICLEMVDAAETGGTGTASFVDNYCLWHSMGYNVEGYRLGGSQNGNVFDQPALFPQADNAVGIVSDAVLNSVEFRAPRFDDPQDSYTGTVAFSLESDHNQGGWVSNPWYNNIDSVIDKPGGAGKRLFYQQARDAADGQGERYRVGEVGGPHVAFTGGGQWQMRAADGTANWAMNSNGQVVTVPGTAINGAGDYAIFGGDFYAKDDGGGIKVDTPDGTDTYRIRVDNAGNVVTDLV